MKAHFFLAFKILKKSFSFYRNHFIFLIKLALAPCLPWSAMFVLFFFLGWEEEVLLVVLRVFSLVALFLIFLLYIAVVKAVQRSEQGQRKDILSCYLEAVKLLPSFLKVLGLMVIKILLWALLLIVPGLVFGCFYSFSLIAFLLDGKKGKEALYQSKYLIKPNLGRFIVSFSVISIVMQLCGLIIVFWAGKVYGIPLLPKNCVKLIGNVSLVNLFIVVANSFSIIFGCFLYREFCNGRRNINPVSIQEIKQ